MEQPSHWATKQPADLMHQKIIYQINSKLWNDNTQNKTPDRSWQAPSWVVIFSPWNILMALFTSHMGVEVEINYVGNTTLQRLWCSNKPPDKRWSIRASRYYWESGLYNGHQTSPPFTPLDYVKMCFFLVWNANPCHNLCKNWCNLCTTDYSTDKTLLISHKLLCREDILWHFMISDADDIFLLNYFAEWNNFHDISVLTTQFSL